MPTTIWHVEGAIWIWLLTAAYFGGLGLAFISTFQIDHFELFGLKQGWFKFKQKTEGAPVFSTPLLYRFVRHPLYLGFLISFWATPHMTAGHLLFSAIMTAYVFIAVGYEERDLADVFGEQYHAYMKKVPSILPFGGRK